MIHLTHGHGPLMRCACCKRWVRDFILVELPGVEFYLCIPDVHTFYAQLDELRQTLLKED